MTIRRPAFRVALLLTCSTLSLTAFCPSASSQEPPLVQDPQATQTDEQRQASEVQREQAAEQRAAARAAAGEHQSRARLAGEAELAQPKAWLGIGLKEVSGDLAAYLGSTKGVLVESVFPDSPAEAAGIHVGDVIIAINGERVADPRALIEALLKLDSSSPQSTESVESSDRPQSKETDREPEEPEQKEEEASREEREADRRGEQDQRDTAKDDATYSPVKLTVLRQGKELEIEVTPGERPQGLVRPTVDIEVERPDEIAELEQMLRELELQGGARVFRFGPPAKLTDPSAGAEKRIENVVIITKDASGQSTEVRIEREGDQPAKITVREGGKTHEISEDQVDQLPEKVRDAARQALQQRAQARATEHGERSTERELRGQPRQRLETHRRLREQLRELPGGHVTILSPEELRQMGQSAEELAAKYQKLAEEMARRGVQKAQDFAGLPDEIKELQAQVKELNKQVEELRAQIKAEKP